MKSEDTSLAQLGLSLVVSRLLPLELCWSALMIGIRLKLPRKGLMGQFTTTMSLRSTTFNLKSSERLTGYKRLTRGPWKIKEECLYWGHLSPPLTLAS